MFPFNTGNYIKKVRSVRPESLVALWPQSEPLGHAVSTELVRGYDGSYAGVTLGQPGVPGTGMTSAGYDGATSVNYIYSASLNAALDGAEGTLLVWAKVSGVGVWTDATERYIARLYVDASNYIDLRKSAGDNDVWWIYRAGGTTEAVSILTETSVDWICYGISWSKSGVGMRGWRTAVQVNGTQAIAGIWAGNLSVTDTTIGASNNVPAKVWDGTIGPAALWRVELTPDQITYLSYP